MPFISLSQISMFLPENIDNNFAEAELLKIQIDLENIGLVFDLPLVTTINMESDILSQTIIYFKPVAIDTNLSISIIDNGQVTIPNYFNIKHLKLESYLRGIRLLSHQISFPSILSVTGKFGIYIDFNSNSKEANLIKQAICKFISKNWKFSLNDNRVITEAKTGDSSVRFDTVGKKQASEYDYYPNISIDPDFYYLFDYFLC